MEEKKPLVFTDRVRLVGNAVLEPIARVFAKLGIHPDVVTLIGLLLVMIACVFIARGEFLTGSLLLLLGLPFDALDGAVARVMQRKTRFGAVFDSTLDRYADGFICAALAYYFAVLDRFDVMLLAILALIGSQLVSYVRARADGVHVETKIGLFTRLERIAVILIMLFIPALLEIGVLILAVGTNFTALQRLWYVYTVLQNRGE